MRLITLGASNLTRGFHTVVSTARAAWGPDVEVFAALGHGRSYGVRSRFMARELPGILESGLWHQLQSAGDAAATRALITDVGNDIIYGFSPDQTIGWIEEATERLHRFTSNITLTDLPLASIRALSNAKYLALRSIIAPQCRLSLVQVVDGTERVNEGLIELARRHGLSLLHLKPEWYGVDPIHIRPSLWHRAWQEILGAPIERAVRPPLSEAVRLYLMRPQRRWLFGIEQVSPQPGLTLPSGGRVWMY